MAKQYKDRFVVTIDGQRKTIRNKSLFEAKATKSQMRLVRQIANLLEELELAKDYGLPPTQKVLEEVRAITWLNEKCVELGLIPANCVNTLEELFDFYFELKFKVWTKRTQENWLNTKRTILKVLDGTVLLRSITRIDADNVQHDMKTVVSTRYGKRLSSATISKHLGNLRQLFNFAVKHEFLTKNVFDEISRSGESRDDHFEISLALSERVLEAMPNSEWRLYFAVLRWAGCRKSEPLQLKVGDWELGFEKDGEHFYGRLFIPDAKRKNKSGNRIIKSPPLFKQIEKLLLEHCEVLPECTEYLFPNIRKLSEGGIHERFTSFLKRKGITVWSNLFNNIRSTRSTEISREYGSALESRWVGHSEATFKMSYDFDIQADYRIRDTNVTQQSGAGQGTANLVDKVVAQKQHIQPDATLCIEYKKRKAPPKGFEDVSHHRGNEEFSTGADTNVTQLADLKALLSSIDPIILKQLLVEILKE